MRVLVVNAGSSSLKLSVVGSDGGVLDFEAIPVVRKRWDPVALDAALERFPVPDAVGHRVVHGGREFVDPVRLDERVMGRLRSLGDLAPLHQPKSLAGIEAIGEVLPDLPAVACFDTAFHAGLPAVASTYAVPDRWRREFGVRRYGFHGLSHAYASRRAIGVTGGVRVVTAHLGAGASLAAVRDGHCVDTTMGFTPLEGLVMATRSGSVDPGMLLWLNQHAGVPVEEIADALEHRSGLLALAGTADMREVLAREDSAASLAVGVYVHRLRASIAAMAASLGGLDTLVFTGGVGEGSAPVRRRTAQGLEFLGVDVDRAANEGVEGEGEVSARGARVRTLVVRAGEDVEVAEGTRRVLGVV